MRSSSSRYSPAAAVMVSLTELEAEVLSAVNSGRCCQVGPLVNWLVRKRSLTREMAYDVLWSLRRKGLLEDYSLTKGRRRREVKVVELSATAARLFFAPAN